MEFIPTIFKTQSNQEKILYIKKKEYESYYSTKNKYPYIIIERLSMRTGLPAEGENKVKRNDIEDPFAPEPSISPEFSFTKEDYNIMMSYGLSPGHNAPAGHHYTSKEIWEETFNYVNICPQEMVFNSGIWVLIENWCKYISKLQKQNNFTNLRIFTGSIPNSGEDTVLSLGDKKISVNIPTHMYKLVCARSKDERNKNKIFMCCFICPNRPINPIDKDNQNIIKWTIPYKELEKLSNINFEPLLNKYYGYEPKNYELVNINDLVPIKFTLNPMFEKQMVKSLWYGLLIYAKTLKQLEKNWEICQLELKDEKIEFHREFYNLTKKRLELEGKHTTSEDLEELDSSSNKLRLIDAERGLLGTGLNTNTSKDKGIFFGLFKGGNKTRKNKRNYKNFKGGKYTNKK